MCTTCSIGGWTVVSPALSSERPQRPCNAPIRIAFKNRYNKSIRTLWITTLRRRGDNYLTPSVIWRQGQGFSSTIQTQPSIVSPTLTRCERRECKILGRVCQLGFRRIFAPMPPYATSLTALLRNRPRMLGITWQETIHPHVHRVKTPARAINSNSSSLCRSKAQSRLWCSQIN